MRKDGEYTGRWVYRRVGGKYARMEFYRVGQMVNRIQYRVHLDGHPEYSATWGATGVRYSLAPDNPEDREYMRQHNIFLVLCESCQTFPKADPYKGKYLCKCGMKEVVMSGRWQTCANCDLRFKSKTLDYICGACRGQ